MCVIVFAASLSLFFWAGQLMEAEALLNALRDHVACCLPFSCAKKVLACFQLMANGDGRAWEHSQYESEMKGKKIRKNYLNHGKYLSWGARIAMDTFTVCSAVRNCWFDIIWARWLLDTRHMHLEQKMKLLYGLLFSILNIHFNSSPTI